jgi:hypothetical protein
VLAAPTFGLRQMMVLQTVGSNLTGWTDQTGTNTFTVNGTPGYVSNAINFNPVATFDNAETPTQQPGDYLEGNTSITYQDGFAVFKKSNAVSGALIGSTVSMTAYGAAVFAGYSDNQIWMSDGLGSGGSWSRFENPNVAAGNVALAGYDILGKEVAVLVNQEKQAGNYNVEFNATNLTSGVYFYKIQSGNFSSFKKMMLIK